jgi:hypothetical protein
MRYLCAVYLEPDALDALSATERTTLDHDSLAYDVALQKSGHYIHADALQPVNTARTVKVRRGKISQTDGPFAETKEILGGFILIEAKDMDEAVEIAAKIPMAKYGSIEVRPSMDISSRDISNR